MLRSVARRAGGGGFRRAGHAFNLRENFAADSLQTCISLESDAM
jgi:hypothetical protein